MQNSKHQDESKQKVKESPRARRRAKVFREFGSDTPNNENVSIVRARLNDARATLLFNLFIK